MHAMYSKIKLGKRTSRKKLKGLRRAHRQKKLEEFGKKLNDNLPPSEKWFHEKFKKEEIERIVGNTPDNLFHDQPNAVFGNSFIPDITNKGYKYIIEVDGSSHNRLKVALQDFAKDTHYKRKGYKVFRVKAYDDTSYNKFIEEYKTYIDECHHTTLISLYNSLKFNTLLAPETVKQGKMRRNNIKDTKLVMIMPDLQNTVVPLEPIKSKPVTILRRNGQNV